MTSPLRKGITRPGALQLNLNIQICLPCDDSLPAEVVSSSSSFFYDLYLDQECDDDLDEAYPSARREAESPRHTCSWACVDCSSEAKPRAIPVIKVPRAPSRPIRLGADIRHPASTTPLGPCTPLNAALGPASEHNVGTPSLSIPQAPISFVMHASRGLGNENSWRSRSFQFGSPLSPNPRFRPGTSFQTPRSPMTFGWDCDFTPSLSPSESFDSEDSFPSTPITPDSLFSPLVHHHFSHPPLPKFR